MVSIQEHNGCTLTELSREMHVSAPTVTGIIDRMERDGYVKRSHDPNDRRVIHVALTKKGEGIVGQFRDNIRKRWQYILSKMPVEVGETVVGIMTRLTKGFKDGAL